MHDICIYVVDHRHSVPIEKFPYRLLRVGSCERDAEHPQDVDFDCTGDSIAYKNFAYSELTGLYWIWKNTHHSITGLMHYRRFLAAPDEKRPLDAAEIEAALESHDFLVPRPAKLGFSLAEHYCYCHVSFDLTALEDVMARQPKKYALAFSQVMGSDTIIPCNIMIAKKPLLDAYCAWLFSILEQCEQAIDLFSGRDAYQMRVFGFLSERLLLVWLVANSIDCGFYDVLTFDSAEVLHGQAYEGYDLDLLSAKNGLTADMLFDDGFYRDRYKDVGAAYPARSALNHYLEHGIAEGRIPSPAYSMDEYAALRPKLRARIGGMSSELFDSLFKEAKRRKKPVLSKHYVLGITRDRMVDYAPVYDWLYYTTRYDDVPNDYFKTEEALRHFIEVGIPEGRQGSKGFSLNAYKEAHPDLVRRFGDDNKRYYMHYALGKGRKRHPVDWRYVE